MTSQLLERFTEARPFRLLRLSKRTATLLSAAALAFVTAVFASRGIHWAQLHPDELIVERRTRSAFYGKVIHKEVFPAGYYRLAKVMNRIDGTLSDINHGISDWMQQEEEKGTAPIYRESDQPPTRPRLLLRIREWNVILAVISTLLVFFLLRTLFEGKLLATSLGTLLYAAHPFVIEHSHYAETDAALLATEALALLLMALALRDRRPWQLVAAAFVAGFAVSMKFSCLLFAGVLSVEAFVLARRLGWRKRCASALAAGTLTAMLAGYLVGTPMLLVAPRTYLELSRVESQRVYAENAKVLSKLAGLPFANLFVKGRAMLDEASRLGWGWWLWALLCTPLWFSRPMRRNWAGVPLFGLAYLPFAFLSFPWFRQQEYLPMLPFLAATMALPLACFPFPVSRCRLPVSRCLRLAALAAVLCVAVSTVRDSARVSSAFTEIETHRAAERWLGLCAPRHSRFGFEPYALVGVGIVRRPDAEPTDVRQRISKLESYEANVWADLSLDYFVRSPDRRGRYAFNPLTGRRFPKDQSRYDAILADAMPLRSWHVSPDDHPKFSQVSLELYGRSDGVPVVADVPALPTAPLFVFGNSFGTRAMRVGKDSPHVGPVEAVQLTRRKVTVAFDPLPKGERYYAVAMNFNAEQPARVSWTRGFEPASTTVPPNGAALFISTSSLYSPWRSVAESRVRSNLDGQEALTLVAVTADRALAESLLRRHGASDEAIALGRDADAGTPAAAEALLAASDTAAARGILGPVCTDAISALGGETVAPGIILGGLPLRIQDDFSRICLGPFTFGAKTLYPGSRARKRPGFLWAEFPIVLEPGRYTLRLFLSNAPHLTARACDGDPERALLPSFDAIGAKVLSAHATGWARDGSLAVEIELACDGDNIPFLLGVSVDRGVTSVASSGITLRWHPADVLASLSSD